MRFYVFASIVVVAVAGLASIVAANEQGKEEPVVAKSDVEHDNDHDHEYEGEGMGDPMEFLNGLHFDDPAAMAVVEKLKKAGNIADITSILSEDEIKVLVDAFTAQMGNFGGDFNGGEPSDDMQDEL